MEKDIYRLKKQNRRENKIKDKRDIKADEVIFIFEIDVHITKSFTLQTEFYS